MEYKLIKLNKVKRSGYNPRKISDFEMEKLKLSLKEFGCVRPLVINKTTKNLVSGHQMLDAAHQLGIQELPYLEIEIPLKKEKTLNIALNKIQGEWNYDLLNPILKELKEEELLNLTGFNENDIDLIGEVTDTGGIIEEGELLDPMKNGQLHELTFKFDNEIEMKRVKKHFQNKKHGWKDKGLNSNQLIKLIDSEKKALK